ncbi:MAG: Acetophenone carboxylase delta subunit [Alphaproteobacteria bacterium MarineAlpha4_Bin2]|nr:MAG: Acetophenone carboxylase delta subunit [Alphaproteobacteria bacterium MarineAlpha4_Bin2]
MNEVTRDAGFEIDALTLAVVRQKLLSVSEEIVETMVRTCFSPLLNQSRDLSAVVLDGEAQVVAQAERTPIHMGAMPFAVRAMAEDFGDGVTQGDVIMANDPYWGGSHLPDITLVKPVFREERLRFWVAIRAHQSDTGGISAGGYSPSATEIFHEGLRIPPVKLADSAGLRHDVLRMVCENTRKPEDTHGDVLAMFASVNVGVERLEDLLDRYGTERIDQCTAKILDAGEAAMRAHIRQWKPGVYNSVSYLDHDGVSTERYPVPVTVTVREGEIEVDFREVGDQVAAYFNSPIANTSACVYIAFFYLSNDQQVLNEGSTRAIKILTRKGSLVDPVSPAPVTGCTTFAAAVIIESVIRAMAKAAPNAVVAGAARRFRYVIAGQEPNLGSYIYHYFSNKGGFGANNDEDGWVNIGGMQNPGGTPSASLERVEASYPFSFEEYALKIDSGGSGRQRGGAGGVVALRFRGTGPAVLNIAGEGTIVTPYGINNGLDGAPHVIWIERGNEKIQLDGRSNDIPIKPGDLIVHHSAGGGGCGDPQDRAREFVHRDLEFEYITPEAARDVYGLGD